MTLTELRYIVTLAQEQHFGRAAERCHVSQPTLSIAVKKLEEDLEMVIFERSKNRVYATPLGEKIVDQAQKVLEQASSIRDIANEGKDQLLSPLSIGAIFTVGPYLFPNLIPEIQNLAPEMPLYVEETFTATLRRRIRQGELDALVVSLPFTEADVVTQPLYDENFVVLMAKDHPLNAHETISPEQLEEFNVLLMGEGHCFRNQVLEFCPNLKPSMDSKQGQIRTAKEGSSLETLKYMVSSRLGITILPESAANADATINTSLTIRRFVEPQPKRTVALAWRASFPRLKAIDVLRDAIKKSVCSQPPRNIQ